MKVWLIFGSVKNVARGINPNYSFLFLNGIEFVRDLFLEMNGIEFLFLEQNISWKSTLMTSHLLYDEAVYYYRRL